MRLRRPNEIIDTLVIHHSNEPWGGADVIAEWHGGNSYYNSIIENSYPDYKSFKNWEPKPEHDGRIVKGRGIEYYSAGVRGHNDHTVHLCIVGVDVFSAAQLDSLKREVLAYFDSIPTLKYLKRHCDFDPENKPHCPSLSAEYVAKLIE